MWKARMLIAAVGLGLWAGCAREDRGLLPLAPEPGTDVAATAPHSVEFTLSADGTCSQRGDFADKASCSYTGKDHALLSSDFRRIGLTVCRSHFPAGSEARGAIEDMIAHLNGIEGVAVSFSIAGEADHAEYSAALDADGINRIEVVDPADCTESDCSFSGRTRAHTNAAGQIGEVDVVLNKNVDWYYGEPVGWDLEDGNSYLRTVLLHELGHGVGFPHVLDATSDLSIMGSKTGKWVGQRHAGLKAYDFGHLHHHYADGANVLPELTLSNYTTEWSDSLANWQCALTAGLTPARVVAGRPLRVTYTTMNRGAAFSGSYRTTFYLSHDETVTASDVVLGSILTASPEFPAYHTALKEVSLTVPAGTRPGTWHVVVVIDSDDQVAESRESNNRMVIHEQLVVRSRDLVPGGLSAGPPGPG